MEVHDLEYDKKDLGDNKWEERWFCPFCQRMVVYDPYEDEWVTLNKGDQSVKHHGSIGVLQLDGSVNTSVPAQFEEFINGLGAE